MTVDQYDAMAVVNLGRLALQFGRVDRVTFHEDGETPESDTDHTVMLGLIAPAFAAEFLPQLDPHLVASFAMVHDLVEAYAGDTPTLNITPEQARLKRVREHDAFLQIQDQFRETLPWVANMIEEYEAQDMPEARFVKAMDKQMPKITHILNGGRTIFKEGISRDQIQARYLTQTKALYESVDDMEPLFELRAWLLKMMDEAIPWEEMTRT